jgi:5,10-methylene-tetrahydrofolate dehydrogenase/methenyl tetrahydrofolate cyclohydrolase
LSTFSDKLKFHSDQIKKDIKERGIRPKLVGFLANEDPAAIKYAEWTAKTCAETGVEFELRKVDKQDLEQKIDEANDDKAVNGIMVYYPVFGGKQVKSIQSGERVTNRDWSKVLIMLLLYRIIGPIFAKLR